MTEEVYEHLVYIVLSKSLKLAWISRLLADERWILDGNS